MTCAVVVPNWNGVAYLKDCLDSLLVQTLSSQIIVVDNGSTDGSKELIRNSFPTIHLIELDKNYGFTGGVNPGLSYAIDHSFDYVALFNNDAVAESTWLERLVTEMEAHPETGIVTSKIKHFSADKLDSTGDLYSTWALPFPRGRDEEDHLQYDQLQDVFGASGGASLYRCSMLAQIGLFDDHFFAYFEDIDISFRAQLEGFKVRYEPNALVRHHIGGTSGKHQGFGRYHTVKNYHYVYTKNMPGYLYFKYLPKYWVMTALMTGSDLRRGLWRQNLSANLVALRTLPVMLVSRRRIQRKRTVSVAYIDSILYHQLPPTQKSFSNLRHRLIGR